MGKIFAVTSGKGGVGKSTVAVGLGLTFCRKGEKVLLVDMDEGLACLDIMLGIDEPCIFTLSDILLGKEISDVVYKSKKNPNIHLIPAPETVGTIDAFAFTNFANTVKDLYDIVIFDFPAGIDFSLYTCLPKETLFMTVAFPDPVTVRDASIVSRKLYELGFNTRLIINNFQYKLTKNRIHKNIDEIIDQSALRLLGIVPKSDELALLSINHKLKPRGNAMKAFSRISKRLCGENILLPHPKKI